MSYIDVTLQQVDITDATRQKAAERYAMQDVAILTQLKCRETKQVVTVVNTHVDFGEFKKPDLQILQVNLHDKSTRV